MGRFGLGMIRLGMEYYSGTSDWSPAEGGLLDLFVNSNFLHFAIFLFIISSLTMILVSYTAPAFSAEKLKNVVYVKPEKSGEGFNPGNRDFWLTLALIAAVLLIWIIFSPIVLG
ncbi:MAG: hypothetical protein R2879_08820 [Saprospiraceae bacterium]